MRFFKEFGLGFSSYSRAYKFIGKHNLRKYLFLPGIINLVLFIFLFWLTMLLSDACTEWFMNWIDIDQGFFADFAFYFFLILFRVIQFFIFYFTYKYIVLILIAPALAILAQKIHRIQTGENKPFNFKQFLSDVLRGVALAFRNMFWEILIFSFVNIISIFVPILAPFAPFVLFFIGSYFYGFAMMDYKCELLGYSIKKSSKLIWKHKGYALGNGSMFSLLLFIPIFGALIGPVLSLAAAQIAFFEIEEDKKNASNS